MSLGQCWRTSKRQVDGCTGVMCQRISSCNWQGTDIRRSVRRFSEDGRRLDLWVDPGSLGRGLGSGSIWVRNIKHNQMNLKISVIPFKRFQVVLGRRCYMFTSRKRRSSLQVAGAIGQAQGLATGDGEQRADGATGTSGHVIAT